MPTADPTETTPGDHTSKNRTPKSGIRRALFIPAALGCLAVLVAACSSGGSPSPSDSANALISQGLSAQSSGNTQQAINDFNDAVAKNPANPVPYYDLGVIYQQYLKKPAQAITFYNKALLADASYRPAIYNLAILDTSSNPQEAITLYNQLIQSDPNDSNSLYNLGLILYDEGQTAQGQTDIQKAILINPALKNRLPAGITP